MYVRSCDDANQNLVTDRTLGLDCQCSNEFRSDHGLNILIRRCEEGASWSLNVSPESNSIERWKDVGGLHKVKQETSGQKRSRELRCWDEQHQEDETKTVSSSRQQPAP